jgi:type VI secretion system protein ImpM
VTGGTEALSSVVTGLTIGLFGKLPSHGDFLERRAPPGFVAAWDRWLQEAVLVSRADLAERWLERYLTSPIWRFYCSAGVCGSAPVVGFMVPSVDCVGRYFPFTVVVALTSTAAPGTTIRQSHALLASAEQLVLDLLDSRTADFDGFDEQLVALSGQHALPGLARMAPADASAVIDGAGRGPWHLAMPASAGLDVVFDQLVGQRLTSVYGPHSVWWTEGSADVEPSSLLVSGLPPPPLFAAMMDGGWAQRGWATLAVASAAEDPSGLGMAATVSRDGTLLQFQSAALSDVGRVRRSNQDAYIERTEVGIWAVADGLGGLSEGDLASRMVCDAIADVAPAPQLEVTLERARQRLADVNDYLQAKGEHVGGGGRSASTVVALFVSRTRAAALWAGDSRIYRWRNGVLEQLTHDHSLGAGFEGEVESTAITRAVGAERAIAFDVLELTVMAGDRFLLCSDGLTRVLPDARLSECLARGPIQDAVATLVAETLTAGAPDNVTAIIVEAVQ